MHELQFDKNGFNWEDISKPKDGIIVFRRKAKDHKNDVIIILNVIDYAHEAKTLIIKGKNQWAEIHNTDDESYWGSGNYTNKKIFCESVDKKKKLYKINIRINAFSAVVLQ